MAITASEIHNQSFSIDRKGYDVDEVDVFLEHVADEIDALNAQIDQLESQLEGEKFDGFDTPAASFEETNEMEELLAEKEARIADLETQLEAKKADDNAIAQALIIAQRSADEILANANAKAAATIQDAKDEAQRIIDKAEAEKQDVLDEISKLEDDREDVREEYQDLLKDFIGDATRKLAEIGGTTDTFATSAHARPAASYVTPSYTAEASSTGKIESQQMPINDEYAGYSTPAVEGAPVVAAATPTPSAIEKDLSGYGDADADFELEEVD